MNIRIIGYGRLAKAMAFIWKKEHQLHISSPSLSQKHDENCTHELDNTQALDHQDMIVLAVKPKLIASVIKEITPYLKPNSLIVSLAAGVTLDTLKKRLPKHVNVIRAMPNIASELGLSATLLFGKETLSANQISSVEHCFKPLGSIDWVNSDDLLDIGTILAGSGPAYVFYIMQGLKESAVRLGMSEKLAERLIIQTFLGASQLALQKTISLQELQQQVTSPQGTTAAALSVLEDKQMFNLLDDALSAAWNRVLELRQ